ncbi:MAG: ABC transporter permease [Alphaproteobacteria bacterium]|nr:ABC transporter permease [Alphaproteobacteria bacterium]
MAAVSAINDIVAGALRWRLWSRLGWYDLRSRYRRSHMGLIWIALTTGIFVGSLGTLYSILFGRDPAAYIPHLALGFITWTLLSSVVTSGCRAFIQSQRFILEIYIPLSTFILKTVWQHVIIFGYQLSVFVAVAIIFDLRVGLTALLFIPGFALILLNAVWVALLMGIFATRFRDLAEIATSVLRIVFFMTPIIWMPDMIGIRAEFLELNPFYHFIELVRSPLLNVVPKATHWLVAVAALAIGWPITIAVFKRLRNRIPFWL